MSIIIFIYDSVCGLARLDVVIVVTVVVVVVVSAIFVPFLNLNIFSSFRAALNTIEKFCVKNRSKVSKRQAIYVLELSNNSKQVRACLPVKYPIHKWNLNLQVTRPCRVAVQGMQHMFQI